MTKADASRTVTMVFPRAVKLNVTEGGKTRQYTFDAGTQEVPEEHADHSYLRANGVKLYDHDAVAKKAREEADKAGQIADEAHARLQHVLARKPGPRPGPSPTGRTAKSGTAAEMVPNVNVPAAPSDVDTALAGDAAAQVAPLAVAPADMKVAELRTALDERGLPYAAGDTRDTLVAKLEAHGKAPEDLTVQELKDRLTAKGIDFDKSAKKSDLIELLAASR